MTPVMKIKGGKLRCTNLPGIQVQTLTSGTGGKYVTILTIRQTKDLLLLFTLKATRQNHFFSIICFNDIFF